MDGNSREEQKRSSASTVKAAAKTGKAVANIAKGVAAGGTYGAASAVAKGSKKLILPLVALLLLPFIIVAMVPTVIFGAVFTWDVNATAPNGIADDTVLKQNVQRMNDSISRVLSDGLAGILLRIEADYAASGCYSYEVNNPYGEDVRFNANYFISLYCASRDQDVASISIDDMADILSRNKDKLYTFTYRDEVRLIEVVPEDHDTMAEEESDPEATPKPTPTYVEVSVRVYTITYNGEAYFGNEVFRLTDEQKSLASDYAQNLSMLLHDGNYQVLSETEFFDLGYSYEGVIFTNGETQVFYYNQYDERWKDLPYGTDNIGGYACGPTSMAIVVSSLTSETVDPPHMAQWAYENGHWCSKSGSYHSIVSGAAREWGLSCEACPRSDPQRLVDALSSGDLVVAIMGPGHFTRSGHFIVLRGVTADGTILVADPASYKRSEQEWELSIILKEGSAYAANDAPFWIISPKEER